MGARFITGDVSKEKFKYIVRKQGGRTDLEQAPLAATPTKQPQCFTTAIVILPKSQPKLNESHTKKPANNRKRPAPSCWRICLFRLPCSYRKQRRGAAEATEPAHAALFLQQNQRSDLPRAHTEEQPLTTRCLPFCSDCSQNQEPSKMYLVVTFGFLRKIKPPY